MIRIPLPTRRLPTRRLAAPRQHGAVWSAALGLVLLTGCATTGGDSRGPDDQGAPTLTLATGFVIDDLDPLTNGFWGPEFGYAELLMRPQRGAEPTPWVLSELTNQDPTTWVLTLHDEITFHNGRALDGDALAALLNYQLAENEDFAAALPGATATVTGDLQVTLNTTSPAPNVPFLLADESMVPVYDVLTYQRHLRSEADPAELVGAGLYTAPYVVDSLDGEAMRLSPDPDYWDGTPGLRELTVQFVPEASARIQAVQSQEVDIALYPPTTAEPALRGREDATFVTGPPSGPTFQLQLNQQRAPFDDPRVRRAVYAGIDYTELADDVMSGLYEPAIGLYSDDQPWAVRTQRTDLGEATRLLDEAGWTRSTDGTRTREGDPLAFTISTYPQQPDSGTLALAAQSQLDELGFQVGIAQVPDINATTEDADAWQAAVVGTGFLSFGGDYVTPLVRQLHSDGPSNVSGAADPKLDALIDQVAVELDPEIRDELLGRVQIRIADGGDLGYLGSRRPAVVAGPEWVDYEVPISNLWVDANTAPGS